MKLPRLIEIQPRPNFKLWVRYSDGTEGVVDLSDVAGKGVFSLWDTPGEFEKARIGTHGEIVWDDRIDICPDTIYFEMTGENPEKFFRRSEATRA
jgi:hypothetical protein